MKAIATAAVLCFLSAGLLQARIIHVPGDYSTIQTGINASEDGDTVLVNEGVYHGYIFFNGHNVVLASYFLIDEDTSHISRTVLDGGQLWSVITAWDDETSPTSVVGFTIRNGEGDFGGGIAFLDVTGVTIADNIIVNNVAYLLGGGVYLVGDSSRVLNNQIASNRILAEAGGGGGVFEWQL